MTLGRYFSPKKEKKEKNFIKIDYKPKNRAASIKQNWQKNTQRKTTN